MKEVSVFLYFFLGFCALLAFMQKMPDLPLRGEYRMRLSYNKVGGVNAGVARTNNRNKNQNWMVFRIEVSGANINNRNSVA